ncbi:hypothetical protein BG004_007791 [Podila humilis]|nr:hypothetical protein BG004_007791 [Podila humilis]
MDDGYHSEETQKRQTIGISSMNWILRRRFVKCHQWMPSMWSAEDNSIVKDDQDQVVDESDKESANKDTSMESMNRYSSIRRALVRTLSGSVKPSKSKRVTFNEQVLILGRRLSGDVAKETASSSSPSVPANLSMTPHTVPEDVPSTAKGSPALEAGSKPATATSGLDTSNRTLTAAQTNDILQEETEYQTTIAAQDINGSGSSSPVCHHCSAHSTASLPPELSPAASATSSSSSQMSSDSSVTKDSPELRRSASAPLKLGSFFNRNNHRGNSNSNVPQQNTLTQHSATFSESSTLGQNPRAATVNITLPSYSSTGTCTATTSFMVPQRQELSSAESTPRSSLSLGTRAKRSISLVIPRPNSVISATSTVDSPKSNSSSTELQGSIGRKNKNLMYRIVHPQRYKREMEQQLMEQERQRLLTLALLQRRELLAAETTADSVGAKDHLCGDAYFYATSAEYIEGLGARNSVISTSVGISFPEELQDKKPQFKNRGTRPRPASYEYGYTPKALFPGMYDSSSESDIATETSGTAARSSQETPRSRSFVFKRGEKKNGSVSSTKSSKGTRSNGPPNRLQQLFSHPGHKQTQSTSSLIHPPGSAGTYSTATAEMGLQGLPIEVLNVSLEDEHLLPEPVFSSSAAAGAHQLLSRARSDSRTYTSFTTIGTTPAFPPTQSTFSAICSKSSGRTQTSTDRTSFADFGFPSPTLSPVDSMQPASPRHSTSSVHSDMVYSSVEYRAGEQEEQQQQHHHHELLLPEQSSFGREIMFSISPEHAPQQLQELQPVDVNQVKYEMPMQLPTLTEPMTPGTSPESSLIVKESRGKCIMRKFSLRKKKT